MLGRRRCCRGRGGGAVPLARAPGSPAPAADARPPHSRRPPPPARLAAAQGRCQQGGRGYPGSSARRSYTSPRYAGWLASSSVPACAYLTADMARHGVLVEGDCLSNTYLTPGLVQSLSSFPTISPHPSGAAFLVPDGE